MLITVDFIGLIPVELVVLNSVQFAGLIAMELVVLIPVELVVVGLIPVGTSY